MIQVYNTLSKTKEEFIPQEPGKVGMYLCGPTVYKPSHIGHMVGPVIFDTVTRYLKYNGYEVRFIVNITDVDDKLIAESSKRGISMAALAAEMAEDYKTNIRALGVDTISDFPCATQYIPHIIKFVERLIERGYAYVSGGDVYFDVSHYTDYGKLSHRTPAEMLGEGGSTAEQKRNLADFALWKAAKEGEPSWDSPWGNGRPGWHIECSVMSQSLLGDTFEIHGGGLDLVFPHHENEIAQSECCTGKKYVKYWMHNGLMQASSETGKVGGRNTRTAQEGDLKSQESGKISKSRGASAFKDMLKEFSGETIRFFLLATHYRRPIDFSAERIREVETGLETFYRFFQRYARITGESFYTLDYPESRVAGDASAESLETEWKALRKKFLAAMDDDFNTGAGIGELFDLLRCLNRYVDQEKLESAAEPEKIRVFKNGCGLLRELASTLGLFRYEIEKKSSDGANDALIGSLIQMLINLRTTAKKNKDFSTADAIRNQLKDLGITLEDRPGETIWAK